jgi:hypothetical protein
VGSSCVDFMGYGSVFWGEMQILVAVDIGGEQSKAESGKLKVAERREMRNVQCDTLRKKGRFPTRTKPAGDGDPAHDFNRGTGPPIEILFSAHAVL